MKAPDFSYERPETVKEALALVSDDMRSCQPLAGGQSLMPMMNLRMARPDVLVDLNGLSELKFIEQADNAIHIGAMVRYTALMNSVLIRNRVPIFSLALPHIAHQAVRNRGTIGGSVALADPAAEMPALLTALNGIVTVVSRDSQRDIPAEEFFLGIYDTALNEGELIHSLKIPAATDEQRFGFFELARRHGDYAMAGVAISAQSVNPCESMRIVFFGVSDQPLRVTGAEAAFEGRHLSDADALLEARQSLTVEQMYGDSGLSAETRLQLARVVLKRALFTMSVNSGQSR